MMNKGILFSSEEYYEHSKFWKEKTESIANAFKLEVSGRSTSQDHELTRVEHYLEKPQQAILKKYTDFRALESLVFVLSAFTILISRYQKEEQIIINTPLLKERKEDDIWETKVPMILHCSSSSTVKKLLIKTSEGVIQSYKYQNYPFDFLKSAHDFVALNQLSNILILHKSLHEPLHQDLLIGHDLVIEVEPIQEKEGIKLNLYYNEKVFNTNIISDLRIHFNQVLAQYENVQIKVADIEIHSPEQAHNLTQKFNSTEVDYPKDKTVIDLFIDQVRATPEAVAVVYDDTKLTYAELSDHVNKLAIYLNNEFKVRKEQYIGVLLEKSANSIISLLAVMRAGAAYVSIDPNLPKNRIDYIIEDAQIKTVITTSELLANLEAFEGNLFAIDIQMDSLEEVSKNLDFPVPTDTAYLVYTSGSTGVPKGVIIPHTGLVNVALDHVIEFGMSPEDNYLQFMSNAFDGSLLDIFTTLLSGASLVIPTKEIINNTIAFIDYVAAQQITVCTVAPSYLASLNKAIMPSVRVLVSAGEAALVDDAMFYAKGKDYYNGYGPSEVTVNATLYKVSADKSYKFIPIGKPRANKKVYILDENNRLRPKGHIGEICIAGVGLAKGYLNDEELTRKKFISNPFEEGLLYKTGDLGRIGNDDTIEFIGRQDDQVKINGYRIDLGELEHTLMRHELIKEAKALIQIDEDGNHKSLITFFTKNTKMELVPSLGEYLIYDPFIYESMASDDMRVSGYQKALKASVAGKVVVDPGTGSEMILARHCIAAGAKKVYAVEIDEDAFQQAQENLIKYNLQDKITLILGDITEVSFPEKVDLFVSALAGNISSSDGCIPLINKIKENLAYEVDFLPNKYITKMAGISLEKGSVLSGFSDISAHYIQQVFDKYGYPFDLRLCLRYFDLENLLSESAICEDIDYTKDLQTTASEQFNLKVIKSGSLNGFVFWINAFYGEQMLIDSSIETHHLPVYFPVFDESIQVTEGDMIEVFFERTLSDNQINPDFAIHGNIVQENGNFPFHYDSYNHMNSFRKSALYQCYFNEKGSPRNLPSMKPEAIKEYLSASLPVYMLPSRIIELEQFPTTTNGKVDTKALLKDNVLMSETNANYKAPKTEIEELLVGIWESVLGRQKISIQDDFFMVGGDSIKAIQIASKLLKSGYKLEVKDIFEHPIIEELSGVVKLITRIADQVSVTGEIPLTPIQHEVFVTDETDRHHFNQAVMLFSKEGFGEQPTKEVFTKLQEHHDVLRVVYHENENGWQQTNKDIDHPISLTVYDVDDKDKAKYIHSKANEIQRSINLGKGPLMKIALFKCSDGERLLMVIHHLVIDTVSWRIIMEDIQKLYGQHSKGEALSLPLKTDSFQAWSLSLAAYANSQEFLKEKSYWMRIENETIDLIEKDFGETNNLLSDTNSIPVLFTKEETELLLTKVNGAFNTEINDILITALSLALKEVFGNRNALLALEGHGREEIIEEINIGRTVGWFTSMYPLLINLPESNDLNVVIESVKNQLRKVPNKGIGYGILKHLTQPELKKEVEFKATPQISFNYLGQFDADIENISFDIAAESYGDTQSERKQRRYELDFKGMISQKCLQVNMTYNERQYESAKITQIMKGFKQKIQEIIENSKNTKTSSLQPTSFTYSELSSEDIDSIFS